MIIGSSYTRFDNIDELADHLRELRHEDHVRAVRLYTDSTRRYHIKLYAEFIPGTFKQLISKNKLQIGGIRADTEYPEYVIFKFIIREERSDTTNERIV